MQDIRLVQQMACKKCEARICSYHYDERGMHGII